jgi:hypothetical protein
MTSLASDVAAAGRGVTRPSPAAARARLVEGPIVDTLLRLAAPNLALALTLIGGMIATAFRLRMRRKLEAP